MIGIAAFVVAVLAVPGPQQELPGGPAGPPSKPSLQYGATMTAPAKIKDVRPVYPPKAKAAGVSGIVILELALDTAGHVLDAKVLRSIKGLDQAAIDAAMQWRFTPLIVNGEPEPTVITVTVNFARSSARPSQQDPAKERLKQRSVLIA